MDLNTIREIKFPEPHDGAIEWREGDAWLAGGTWLFSERQLHLRRLIDFAHSDGRLSPCKVYRRPTLGPSSIPTSFAPSSKGRSHRGWAWALYENMVFDGDGAVVNPCFRNYRIPAFADVPGSELYFADTFDSFGPLGAKSMSEAPSTRLPPPWPIRPGFVSATCHCGPIESTAVSTNRSGGNLKSN